MLPNFRRTYVIAIGAAVMAVVLAGIVFGGVLLPPSGGGVLPPSDASSQVAGVFTAHLQKIVSRNVTAVMKDYQVNAALTWEGITGGLGGTYKNAKNITLLYGLLLPHFTDLIITNVTDRVSVNGNKAYVNSSFYIAGHMPPSFPVCKTAVPYGGTIKAEVSFVGQGEVWLISTETWNFVYPFSNGICH